MIALRVRGVCNRGMHFQTVLFDLDGTLIDHFRAIHRCHVHTMRTLGLPEPTMQQVRAVVGGGFELAVKRIAGANNLAAASEIFRRHWDEIMLEDAELLPGAREILESLKALEVGRAVITNKRGDSSRLLCERLGLLPLLDAVFGAEDTAWLKPAPEFTSHVLRSLRAEAARTVLIGDSTYDLETARNAGLEFHAVTTGTHSAAELEAAGARNIFSGLPEIHRKLLG